MMSSIPRRNMEAAWRSKVAERNSKWLCTWRNGWLKKTPLPSVSPAEFSAVCMSASLTNTLCNTSRWWEKKQIPRNKLLAEFRCWKMPLLLLFALCSHSFQHRNSVRKFIWHILYVKRFLYWSLYWVPKGAVKSVTGPLSLFWGVHLIIWEARWWGFAPAEKKLLKYSFERRWLVELMWIPRGEVGWAYFSLLHREKSLALIHRLMPRKVVL